MAGFLQRLKTVFSRKEERPPAEAMEEFRRLFRAKFLAFKVLLNANNTALQIMAEMETTLHGQQSFGMTFVRSHATAACVNVFSIIRSLNELSVGKYRELVPVFEDIREQIEGVLEQRTPAAVGEPVLPLNRLHKEMADSVGSKMANLGEIKSRLPEIEVPEGFVITAAAYERFLQHNELQEEINRRLQAVEGEGIADLYRLSSEIQMLIIGGEVPEDLAEAMAAAYRELEAAGRQKLRLALRSSAVGEDAVQTSFAGQYRSELNVSPDNMLQVYKEVLASKYALTALNYRLQKGLRDEDVPMCVGCLKMVDAVSGGVMYSRDPTNIRRDVIIINGVHGLAKTVVDGSVTPDLWEVSKGEPLSITRREIRRKELQAVCLPGEGVILTPDPEGEAPALSDAQVLDLAEKALLLEHHFQAPQDIEWSVDREGRVYILQSRPLQQTEVSDREGAALADIPNPVVLKGGERASPGVAAGPVYLVKNNLDVLQFPDGAVLVTAFAHPGWAALLPRAAAVVTDRGGITGHLANVAREFGIPALFNTFEATRRMTPGQEITVDADGHAIYEGRAELLLAAAPQKKGLMVGTPVFEALKEVMSFVTPLNLTNPESPNFKPQGCRTLHDITRFAHEVSVKEMFSFDRDKAVTRHFIKKLATEVPMQWLVLNLEDGFKEEVPDKEVTLDNINSIPMLALWEGITKVPWEGPPPVDTAGFMSIVLRSAGGTGLEATGDTIYGNQNYFMISKYFCNLTSRLGFHFSTVEALTGEEPFENYLRFNFKGGAADQPRRVLRARFVAEILERYDFKVDVKEDALFARLEGEPLDYMLSRLKVLGYITIHTRQLDMIMLNENEVGYYRNKILADLNSLCQIT